MEHERVSSELLGELPSSELMVKQVIHCFDKIWFQWNPPGKQCRNHYTCPFKDPGIGCTTYENKWSVTQLEQVVVSIFESGSLRRSDSCQSNFI
jgi:hypothetical protein